jgi:DNA-binding FadR family transcriptional regulator
MSTEMPAERMVGDLALAIHEGHISPGEPLPAPERLMASYDVPPATVTEALNRLSATGIITGDASQGRVAAVALTSTARQALHVMAAPAMCRRLAEMPVRPRLFVDPEALQAAIEAFLGAGRRALRGGLTERDADLVAAARNILRDGSQISRAGGAFAPRWDADGRSAGPASADWPVTVKGGVAAAATRSGSASRSRVAASRPAAGKAAAPRPGP